MHTNGNLQTYERKVTGAERFFSHAPFATVTMVARIKGNVTAEMRHRAVEKAQQRHVLLRVRMESRTAACAIRQCCQSAGSTATSTRGREQNVVVSLLKRAGMETLDSKLIGPAITNLGRLDFPRPMDHWSWIV